MLVLTRKLEEQIRIGDDITISILRVKGNTVRVGIEAPRAIRVVRGELPPHELPPHELPPHELGEKPSSVQSTHNVELPESSSSDEGSTPGEVEFADPATTAVRQFLATRARRRNLSSKSHRPVDKALAATLTRSA